MNICNERGKIEGCKKHRSEVQEMIKEIDKKLTVEEAVRIIQEEGYYDFERYAIGGNMEEIWRDIKRL
jgi:N-methylhydantoinase B/oxoprolinase/acetone carboxylase alpha subunit